RSSPRTARSSSASIRASPTRESTIRPASAAPTSSTSCTTPPTRKPMAACRRTRASPGRSGCGNIRSNGSATWRCSAAPSASSCTTCATVRRPSRRNTRFPAKESSLEPSGRIRERSRQNREPSLPASARAGAPLYVPRAAHALAGGGVLRLPDAHRARLLVPLAVLARLRPRRPDDLPRAAPLGRPDLRRGRNLDVSRLERADAHHGKRQAVVALGGTIHPQRRRRAPVRGAVQRRPESPLLGILLVRDRPPPHRPDPLGAALGPLE